MKTLDRKAHWENIYQTKALEEVGWYQPKPHTSLDLLAQLDLAPTAKIIDIGGGDSFLVDHLLDLGYENISVLDISAAALERAQKRLGERAKKVTWIQSDVASFEPKEQYDCWHDRAAFHFLTNEEDAAHYVQAAKQGVRSGGALVLGTFSEQGPKKCSGIAIKQYNEQSLSDALGDAFKKIGCQKVDHQTPSGSLQNFIFCRFKKS